MDGTSREGQGAERPGAARPVVARLVVAHPVLALAVTAAASVAAAVLVSALIASPSNPAPSASTPSATAPARASGRVDLGRIWGQAFAGRATHHESLASAEAQAGAVPAGAAVDGARNTVLFTSARATMTIVANPPTGRHMAFRVAGLENPTIEVRRGALVDVRFVNGDSDSAHGWLLLDPVVQVGTTVHGPRAFPGAYAPILGDPTAAGQPVETIRFRAAQSGTYRYQCPVPGHAAMGMQGAFEVTG